MRIDVIVEGNKQEYLEISILSRFPVKLSILMSNRTMRDFFNSGKLSTVISMRKIWCDLENTAFQAREKF